MDFHTWNTFADIWIPCQHRIHWEVVFFFFLKIKCPTTTSLDLMEFRAQILIKWNLNSMGLNCIWKLWNPDVLWRARSGLCTHLFLLQHLKEGGLRPEKTHWWDFSVNTTSQHRKTADSPATASDTNALISLESELSFFPPTLSPGTTGYI